MRSMLVLVALLGLVPIPQDSKPASMPDLSNMRVWQFAFLKAARGEFKPEPDELAAHLKFLESLLKEHKAVLLGPFEPGKGVPYLGAIVVDAPLEGVARQILAEEPFVKAGRAVLDVYPWFGPRDGFGPPAGAVTDLVSCRLGLLRRPPNVPEASPDELKKIQEGHLANIMKMSASGELAAAGPFMNPGELRGVLLFRIEDDHRIRQLVAEDPAVKAGRLVLDLYPWRVPKGTLPARAVEPVKEPVKEPAKEPAKK